MTQKIKRITTLEAARILGISKTRVIQLVNAGIIAAERVGKQFILKDKDVKAAKGRKHGRPRTKTPMPVIQQVSTEEAKRRELEQLIRNRVQPQPPTNFKTVPRPPVIKAGINNSSGHSGVMVFED